MCHHNCCFKKADPFLPYLVVFEDKEVMLHLGKLRAGRHDEYVLNKNMAFPLQSDQR